MTTYLSDSIRYIDIDSFPLRLMIEFVVCACFTSFCLFYITHLHFCSSIIFTLPSSILLIPTVKNLLILHLVLYILTHLARICFLSKNLEQSIDIEIRKQIEHMLIFDRYRPFEFPNLIHIFFISFLVFCKCLQIFGKKIIKIILCAIIQHEFLSYYRYHVG